MHEAHWFFNPHYLGDVTFFVAGNKRPVICIVAVLFVNCNLAKKVAANNANMMLVKKRKVNVSIPSSTCIIKTSHSCLNAVACQKTTKLKRGFNLKEILTS